MSEISLSNVDKTPLSLVGSIVEVMWAPNNKLAARQCEKCVYVVRGLDQGVVCLELVYDAIEGVHRHDAIYWVPLIGIQYMRKLSEKVAEQRIQRLEDEAVSDMPRD